MLHIKRINALTGKYVLCDLCILYNTTMLLDEFVFLKSVQMQKCDCGKIFKKQSINKMLCSITLKFYDQQLILLI